MDLYAQTANDEQTINDKKAFARYWLDDLEQPYKAALRIYVDRTYAYRCAAEWANDPIVLAEVQRLRRELPEDEQLPSRAQYLRELLDHARKLRTLDPETGFKYDNLYAQCRGHVEKPGTNQTNVQVNVTNRVMVQKDHGNDNEYANTLEAQQAALMYDNSHDATHASAIKRQ